MAPRAKAPSEKPLHKKMVEGDIVREGAKGGVVGTALGAGLRHLGHAGKNAPLYGAAAGTALGAISGYHRGKERQLRDTVQQERQHMRTEARTKKAYNETLWAAFSDEVEKHAFVGAALNTLGRGIAGAGLKSGTTRGFTSNVIGGLRGMGAKNPYQALGGIAAGGALLGAGMLGRATAPSSPGY